MRMISCPHCGAGNSEKRQTCYQCGQGLAAGTPSVSAPPAPPRVSANMGGRLLELETPAAGAPRSQPGAEPAPPKLSAVKQAALSGSMFYTSRGQVKQGAVFFRELSSLLAAGMGVVEAMSHLQSRVGMGSRGVARAMAEMAAAGKPLSEAMAQHPRLFLSYQVGLVQAAELSGSLPAVLQQIAHHLETDYQLRLDLAMRTFIFKVWYIPILLISAPFMFILAHDPTKLAGGHGFLDPLAAIPVLVAAYVYYFTVFTLPVGIGLLLLWVLWPHYMALRPLQRAQETVIRLTPLVGRVFRLSVMARFTGMLSVLWGTGLPPSEALDGAAVASGSRRLAEAVFAISGETRQGVTLSSILDRTGVFEEDVIQHLHVGEISGNLPEALSRLAERYQSEYERLATTLPKVAFIATMAVVACLAGWMGLTYGRAYIHYAWGMPLNEVDRAFQGQ